MGQIDRALYLFTGIVLICLGLVAMTLSGFAATSEELSTNPPAAVNNPPVAVPDSATMRKNTSVAINLLANDYDPDPNTTPAGQIDPASVTITTKPRRGARVVVSETGMATYAPRPKFRGTDVFYYTVKDKEGATSNPAKVTITVK